MPAGITQTERRAVVNAAKEAGAGNAFIVREPILAALARDSGECAVGKYDREYRRRNVRASGHCAREYCFVEQFAHRGNKFDQAIMDYVKKKYGSRSASRPPRR